MESKDKALNKEITKLVDSGVPRPTAISLALDKVGLSREFSSENLKKKADEIEQKNRGGYLNDKGKRNWPNFK